MSKEVTRKLGASDWAMLHWLLTRIGSWTTARWDQHLRFEFGDERAQHLIDALADQGIKVDR